jgi:hypothetical protein
LLCTEVANNGDGIPQVTTCSSNAFYPNSFSLPPKSVKTRERFREITVNCDRVLINTAI